MKHMNQEELVLHYYVEEAEAPEDWSGSVDVEPEDESRADADPFDQEDRRLRADRLEGLDLFE